MPQGHAQHQGQASELRGGASIDNVMQLVMATERWLCAVVRTSSDGRGVFMKLGPPWRRPSLALALAPLAVAALVGSITVSSLIPSHLGPPPLATMRGAGEQEESIRAGQVHHWGVSTRQRAQWGCKIVPGLLHSLSPGMRRPASECECAHSNNFLSLT